MTNQELEDLKRKIIPSIQHVPATLDDYLKALRKFSEQNPHMTLLEFFQMVDKGKEKK